MASAGLNASGERFLIHLFLRCSKKCMLKRARQYLHPSGIQRGSVVLATRTMLVALGEAWPCALRSLYMFTHWVFLTTPPIKSVFF